MALVFRRNKDQPLEIRELDGNFDDLNNRLLVIEGNTTILSVNSKSDANIVLTTNDIAEGASNRYYSESRFNTSLASKTTDNVAEGITNLYYTSNRFNSAFATKTTTNLSEGTNLYFTDERVIAVIESTSIDALADVDTTSATPEISEVLTWDGTKWVPAAPPGAGGGESNVGSNIGTGEPLYKQKVGTSLEFYSLASTDDVISIGLNATSNVIEFALSPSGDMSLNDNKIVNLAEPVSPQDAATKAYVDANGGTAYLSVDGDTGNVTINLTTESLSFIGTGGKITTTVDDVARTITFDLPSTIEANASTATQLATARSIGLTGDVSGSANFDGSDNISITATVADDSHNHIIGNVDGLQTALDAKAPLVSPALTGTPTAPTAVAGTNTTQVATTSFVSTAVANLVDSAPATLDTLNELAAALGDDPNFATTVSTSLGTKAPLASPALTGTPTAPTAAVGTNTTQVATTAFVNAEIANDAPTKTGTGASGTWGISVTGNAATATTASATSATLTRGSYLTGSNFNGSAATTWAVDATSANTVSKVVARDASGNFSAGVITASLNGNADTATTATSATSATTATNSTTVRTVSLSTNATHYLTFVDSNNSTAAYESVYTDAGISYNPSTNVLTASGGFSGVATSALYADLAEKYTSDSAYVPGTVLEVGGTEEVTAWKGSQFVAGVVSTNPAYLMNSGIDGIEVALVGRVPVRVIGTINKGQAVYATNGGVASVDGNGPLIGIALINSDDSGEKLVECILKV